jgi:hypothetical protein
MNNTDTPQITLYAESAGFDVKVTSFGGSGAEFQPFETREDAEAFVALLPKTCKATAGTITGRDYKAGYVQFNARLLPDGVNGGRNEAGIARYRKLRAACEKLGVAVEWRMPFRNAITEAELEELIG